MTKRIQLKQGELEGRLDDVPGFGRFLSFKGIPYAKPPIGALRFKAPQPLPNWSGVWDATKHRDVCLQVDIASKRIKGSEDCLYLNVYSPNIGNTEAKLPVMIYIHGGGFLSGSGNAELQGPHYLMRKEIILVTLNYRLGPLGFLCLHNDDIPGNAGLKDQVAAMKWVKENISEFGGDSDNITIFGESAGSISVTSHLFSPLTTGLFSKVIAMSGPCTMTRYIGENPVDIAQKYCKYLGKETTDSNELAEFLRNLPAEQLCNVPINACIDIKTEMIDLIRQDLNMIFYPVIEKVSKDKESFITESYEELLSRGQFQHVPVLLGCTSGEGIIFLNEDLNRSDEINKNFERYLPLKLRGLIPQNEKNEVVERMKKFYFGDKIFNYDTRKNMVILRSDAFFVTAKIDFAIKLQAKSTQPVYFYVLSLNSRLNVFENIFKGDGLNLTCHGDDLFYLFSSVLKRLEPDQKSDAGRKIESVVQLWTNMAKYGNPTAKLSEVVTTKWLPMSSEKFLYLHIGDVLKCRENPFDERMAFWSDLFEKYSNE